LTRQHIESQIHSKRAVESAEEDLFIELIDLVDLTIITIAEEGGGVLTLAIDAQNRGLLLEAGTVVGAGSMRQVMLDRLQLDLLQIETQLLQAPLDAFPVAVVTAVAHENSIQRAV